MSFKAILLYFKAQSNKNYAEHLKNVHITDSLGVLANGELFKAGRLKYSDLYNIIYDIKTVDDRDGEEIIDEIVDKYNKILGV